MQGVSRRLSLVCCLIGLLALPVSIPVLSAADQAQESAPVLRLEDLERRALDQSPALRQEAARVRAASGRTTQAGLYPNPVIGYNGDEISRGPVIRGGEHGLFVEQPLVMSGRLRVNRRMFRHEQQQAEATAEAQQYRVLNTVRLLYYQALGAERLVQVRADLARIAREAVDISEQLYNVGQADRPDVIEAEVEAERVDLALTQARQRRETVWWRLAEAVGDPSLRRMPLAGSLEDSIPPLDQEQVLQSLVRDSPEIKMTRAGVARADAALTYARVERIPDLVVRGGLRYNRELIERGGQPVGLEGFADAGIRLPLFDRNQGSIAAARADIDRAEHEVKRVQLSLQTRLAVAFSEYRVTQDAVSRYRNTILPRARQAYELYRNKFQQMAAAYPQVLIAQRNLFQLEDEYVTAQVNLWRMVVAIRGFLLVEGFEGRGRGSEE
ncbi:MAG: TolC family protein [Candidatus Latescibacteria bacterium]|nr:TolC family protein [Candidatus Latescibacterota bacterium]